MDNITFISSKDNKIIKEVIKLQKSSKYRNFQKKFVLEGYRICKDALDNNIYFSCLLFTENFYNKFNDIIKDFTEKSDKYFIISDNIFQKISETTSPQGIIAVAKMPENKRTVSKDSRYVALEDINDPSNLGAVSRTAEALGLAGLIISENTCDPYSPKSIRASMGTLLRMPIYITEDIPCFIKENGLKSYSCVVDKDATDINNITFSNGDVIIIGNEANGISQYVKENSDYLITIPMKGKAESLNAAAAAAIAIYELSK